MRLPKKRSTATTDSRPILAATMNLDKSSYNNTTAAHRGSADLDHYLARPPRRSPSLSRPSVSDTELGTQRWAERGLEATQDLGVPRHMPLWKRGATGKPFKTAQSATANKKYVSSDHAHNNKERTHLNRMLRKQKQKRPCRPSHRSSETTSERSFCFSETVLGQWLAVHGFQAHGDFAVHCKASHAHVYATFLAPESTTTATTTTTRSARAPRAIPVYGATQQTVPVHDDDDDDDDETQYKDIRKDKTACPGGRPFDGDDLFLLESTHQRQPLGKNSVSSRSAWLDSSSRCENDDEQEESLSDMFHHNDNTSPTPTEDETSVVSSWRDFWSDLVGSFTTRSTTTILPVVPTVVVSSSSLSLDMSSLSLSDHAVLVPYL